MIPDPSRPDDELSHPRKGDAGTWAGINRDLWAVVFAVAAPALAALLMLLGESGLSRSDLLGGVLFSVLPLLMLISTFASGFVGGLIPGASVTFFVWVLITVVLYVVLDPACPVEFGQRPDGVAAIGVIDSSATSACAGGATPTRDENIGFVIFGGAVATLLAAVGGVMGSLLRKWEADSR